MSKRRWQKVGKREFRFSRDHVSAMIFGSSSGGYWAYGVWGSQFGAEGVVYGLKSARQKANEAIDQLEASK